MDYNFTEEQIEIRQHIEQLCAGFPEEYWRDRDQNGGFPWEFYKAVAEGGWLGLTIPQEYGGSGLHVTEAAIVMQAIAASGGGTQACSSVHLGVFGLQPLILFGTEEAKRKYLPQVVSGDLHVSFGITEPDAGTNTPRITTFAKREGDGYLVSGRKVFITKAKESKKMLLITRTKPYDEVKKKTDGITLFFADIDPKTVEVRELEKCGRKGVDTNMLFIDNLYVAKEDLIGEENRGFEYVLHGMNPERILCAAECIGIGMRALQRASQYAKERVVFDRPIGMNQGIQFPLADAYARLQVAELMVYKAAWLYDTGQACGTEANIAKQQASEAAWLATDRAIQTLGGYGYIKDYDVERYWREARIFRIAPVSNELVLAHIGAHVLGLPKSY